MIVGTAGHIDHGKTTLVRALTGVDTDRLKEEKARGISIELGYAYTALDNGDVLGYIDVPGHERFVHTMVAGACGIDFALLVVAADDGVMPQTREHLAILELLGVRRGAVALTKVDRVAEERVREVLAAVTATLAPTSLRGASLFPVNATDPADPGTARLRQHLHDAAASHSNRNTEKLFRLAIDRIFTLAGHGTVVTGTVFSGQVRVGDTVTLMPGGTEVRVRSIHAQNRPSDTGRAGQRCALNLVGVEKNSISRGDWLADRRALAPTKRIDTRLHLLGDHAVRLETWSPLHFHIGTAHCVAHAVPLSPENPGGAAGSFVQFVTATPLCAVPGDRFIVRDAGAARTIGGGVVLDPFAPSRKRRSAERLEYLGALERMIAGDGVAPVLQHASRGLPVADLVRLTGSPPEHLPLPSDAVTIHASQERFILLAAHWNALRERTLTALREFHAQTPDEPGPDIGRLRRIALPDLPDTLWRALLDELVRERSIVRNGPWLHLPEHTAVLSEGEQALARKLQPLLAAGGFDPPWVRELAAMVKEPEDRVRRVLRRQVTRGALYQVVPDLFYDAGRIQELANLIAAILAEHGAVNAAEYRDACGLGRKRAVQILEFFDRLGYTRRVHDSHVLRKDCAWRTANG